MFNRRFVVWFYQLFVVACLVTSLFGPNFSPAARAAGPVFIPGTPTRIIIPTIQLDSPVIPVGQKVVVINGKAYNQWETAPTVVGWHNLSARLGQVGNTVLAGHSDIYTRIFGHLIDASVGDEIIVYSGEQSRHYIISQKFLVQEKGVSMEQRLANARLIAPTEDERLTLVTCAQPGATHRLIVIAFPATSQEL